MHVLQDRVVANGLLFDSFEEVAGTGSAGNTTA
jgi:hypothetical protein